MMTAAKNISSADSIAHTKGVKILLAAGGTGGHVYPAISIADAIKKKDSNAEILFVGTRDRMEWQTVPKAGYDIKSVWISGFHRRLTPQNLLFPVKLITSLVQSAVILMRFKPDVVISCGGFAAGPVGWVASKMGIPIVVQEQNSFPGVTNRLLAKYADIIFTAFDNAKEYLPSEKITQSGNPIRSELILSDKSEAAKKFGFDPTIPTLLVLGGSGGAKAINEALIKHIRTIMDVMNVQIIWQCGEKYYSDIRRHIKHDKFSNLRLLDYIDDMQAAYSASDLVLTRAGAGTCSELMAIGKPSILIPSPNVAGDHQAKNAEAMVEKGASILLKETNLDGELVNTLKTVLTDKTKLSEMSEITKNLGKPNAATDIADQILRLIKDRHNDE